MKNLLTVVMLCLVVLSFHDSCDAAPAIGGAFNVTKISLGTPSRGLGVDDFNGDGKLDIVNHGSDGNIYLLTNDGSNHFASNIIGSIISVEGGDIGTGDFNGDGSPDFALTDFSDTIHIFINNNDGSFTRLYSLADRAGLDGIDCGDMNGDSKADIAIAGYNPPEVLIYYGNGDGVFATGPRFNPGDSIGGIVDNLGITIGDFNNDGFMDLITGQDDDAEPGAAWLFTGTSDGSYIYMGEAYDTDPLDESGYDFPGAGYPDAFDFDDDGNLEIITSRPTSGAGYPPGIALFFNGDGTGIYTSCDTITQFDSLLMACSMPPIGFPPRNSFSVLGSWSSDTAVLVTYDLIADWSMDEDAGDIVGDSSGNGFDGIGINSSIGAGVKGNCRILNGTDAEIDFGNQPEFSLPTPFSFAFWVKVNNPEENPFIFSNAGQYHGFWLVVEQAPDGTRRFSFNLQGGWYWSEGPLSHTVVAPGTWYHVAGVALSDTLLEIYINGDLDTTMTIREGYLYDTQYNLKIGVDPIGGGRHLNGSIDEVYLFPRAVTPEEISDLAVVNMLYIPPVVACVAKGGAKIPLKFKCQTPTVTMNIPTEWDDSRLALDSASVLGTACATYLKATKIDNVNRTSVIGLFDTQNNPIQTAWDTTITMLYFKVIDSVNFWDTLYPIILDTTFTGVEGNELLFIDTGSIDFLPIINFQPVSITYRPGDANGDSLRDARDVTYLINYLYKHASAPKIKGSGDPDGKCAINALDITYLINFLYKHGPVPKYPCTMVANEKPRLSGSISSLTSKECTIIELNSDAPLAGLEMTLRSLDGKPVTIKSDIGGFKLFYSQDGDMITLGMFDLTGNARIALGKNAILRIDGNVEIISVLGADENADGQDFEIINGASKDPVVPIQFALNQNHPNPFNPTTEINFALPKACDITLEVYNIAGQKVATLVDGTLEAGEHTVQWHSRDQSGTPVASGIYLYRLTAGEFTDSKKMILLK